MVATLWVFIVALVLGPKGLSLRRGSEVSPDCLLPLRGPRHVNLKEARVVSVDSGSPALFLKRCIHAFGTQGSTTNMTEVPQWFHNTIFRIVMTSEASLNMRPMLNWSCFCRHAALLRFSHRMRLAHVRPPLSLTQHFVGSMQHVP